MSLESAAKDSTETFKAGTLLVKENERSRKMYVIRHGKVRVFKEYMGRRVNLAILGEGEIFGELSFFDAEPRSASVEAMSDVTALVIDGNVAKEQIQNLPHWVLPIFKTVFNRLRLADRKMTVLESMNEFQKKSLKNDAAAKMICLELLRFIKTLNLLYVKAESGGLKIQSRPLLKELEELLGTSSIGPRIFWRQLKDHDFMNSHLEESEGLVSLNVPLMEEFSAYLLKKAERDSFNLLGHSSLAILRRIIGHEHITPGFKDAAVDPKEQEPIEIPADQLDLGSIQLLQDGLRELQKRGIFKAETATFHVIPHELYRLYVFQSVMKAFDHSLENMG